MRSFKNTFLLCCIVMCGVSAIVDAQGIPRSLGLWPRGDKAYLAAGQSMPLWPQLPPGTAATQSHLILTITFPPGFSITSWGKSQAFAVQPKPLIVPSSVKRGQSDAGHAIYEIEIPASELPVGKNYGRLALMVNPGNNAAGEYQAELKLGEKSAKVLLTVLPPLDGKCPQRLRIGAYNYNGLTDAAWLHDMDEAVLKSGINLICDMRPMKTSDVPQTITGRLANKGVDGGVIWFWKGFVERAGKTLPELIRKNAEGKNDPAAGLASTWAIEHRNQVMPLLKADLQDMLSSGLYHSVVLDHEERP